MGIAVTIGMTANLDRWMARLIGGTEVGIWFSDDLREAVGDQGTFGGIKIDSVKRTAVVGMPDFRPRKEAGEDFEVLDWPKLVDAEKPKVFLVVVNREKTAGKSKDELAAMIAEGDVFLGKLCLGAATIDPAALAGGVSLLSETQAFFLLAHEVVESALVKSTIASTDRR